MSNLPKSPLEGEEKVLPSSTRSSYHAPTLVDYGTVRNLTRGHVNGTVSDGQIIFGDDGTTDTFGMS